MRKIKKTPLFEIDGYFVVLAHVRNAYPVEKYDKGIGYYWGFKYTDGFYEYFVYKTKKEAKEIQSKFVEALKAYYTQ